MLRAMRTFVRDQRGNSFVEVGFILPILTFMVFGVIDISASYARKLELEQAAQAGVEMVTAAGLDAPDIDDGALQTDVATAAGVDPANVTITRWYQCGLIAQGGSNANCADSKAPALYWRVTVQEAFDPPFGFYLLANYGDPVTLRGTAVVRGH